MREIGGRLSRLPFVCHPGNFQLVNRLFATPIATRLIQSPLCIHWEPTVQ